MKNWHLLVVEDDPDGQELVALILRYHNIPNDLVGTAEDALQALQQRTYDGMIIDLNLPGMDGWSLLHRLQSNGNLTPCIAITAYHTDDLAVQAIEASFKAYFAKPVDLTAFVRELERIF